MKLSLKLTSLAALVVLTGCLSPEEKAEKEQAFRNQIERAYQHYNEHLSPLIDICTTFLETGALDRDRLASLGYKKVTLGKLKAENYKKKVGPRRTDNIFFWAANDAQSCHADSKSLVFHAGPLTRVEEEQMEKLGYKMTGPVQRFSRIYTRNGRSVRVISQFPNSDLVLSTGLTFSLP